MTSARPTDSVSRDQTGARLRWRPSQIGPLRPARAGWILVSLLLALGCTKKTTTAAGPAQPEQQPTAAVQPEAQPDLPELNRSLLRWMMGHRHRPKDFEEFAATAGVTIPPPPAGKKYLLGKDLHIVLVNR